MSFDNILIGPTCTKRTLPVANTVAAAFGDTGVNNFFKAFLPVVTPFLWSEVLLCA